MNAQGQSRQAVGCPLSAPQQLACSSNWLYLSVSFLNISSGGTFICSSRFSCTGEGTPLVLCPTPHPPTPPTLASSSFLLCSSFCLSFSSSRCTQTDRQTDTSPLPHVYTPHHTSSAPAQQASPTCLSSSRALKMASLPTTLMTQRPSLSSRRTPSSASWSSRRWSQARSRMVSGGGMYNEVLQNNRITGSYSLLPVPPAALSL